jgi:uncharacterized membrane protein (UPF0127 family)
MGSLAKVSIGELELHVLVAKTFTERALGLTGVELDELRAQGAGGMVFVMPTERHSSFHMGGMKFPLEMAFFDVFGKLITQVSLEVGDAIYCPPKPFKWVLEVPAGVTFPADARLVLEELTG